MTTITCSSALLAEFEKLTNEIEIVIDSPDIERAIEIADLRLDILTRLNDMIRDGNIDMSEISSISRELLLNELKIITQIEEKKAVVAGVLNQILSGNKAKDIYINISGR